MLYLARQAPCAGPQQQLLAEPSFPFFLRLVQTRDSAQSCFNSYPSDAALCHTCLSSYNEATSQFGPCHHSLLSTGNACPSQLHTADAAPMSCTPATSLQQHPSQATISRTSLKFTEIWLWLVVRMLSIQTLGHSCHTCQTRPKVCPDAEKICMG